MTTDPRGLAALAAALRLTAERWGKTAGNDTIDYLPNAEAWAARALAAIPGWKLVPADAVLVTPDSLAAALRSFYDSPVAGVEDEWAAAILAALRTPPAEPQPRIPA
jgi:hypothetical protein